MDLRHMSAAAPQLLQALTERWARCGRAVELGQLTDATRLPLDEAWSGLNELLRSGYAADAEGGYVPTDSGLRAKPPVGGGLRGH